MLDSQYKCTILPYDCVRIEHNKQSFKYYISHSIPKASRGFPSSFNRFIAQQADKIQELISNHLHNDREETSYSFIIAILFLLILVKFVDD